MPVCQYQEIQKLTALILHCLSVLNFMQPMSPSKKRLRLMKEFPLLALNLTRFVKVCVAKCDPKSKSAGPDLENLRQQLRACLSIHGNITFTGKAQEFPETVQIFLNEVEAH